MSSEKVVLVILVHSASELKILVMIAFEAKGQVVSILELFHIPKWAPTMFSVM